ncbi:hypothetical protein [Rariglobus hedericola]|uniref:Uncharacterized protein n=1 Tax=Rariglobus hedericola TaxID=2597822 RepID=A0A556QLF5_9BACT|nr:hypothetical protein [Rariglobus hedericola]TSJ77465.1 hypothetical protein FPL22_15365 [Rariglobus hedericola]
MIRITLFIVACFAFCGSLRADTDDDTIQFLLKKSMVVVDGTIEASPMGVFNEDGVIDYVIKLTDAKSLVGGTVPLRISISASRFYESEKDELPLLKKGQRGIFFLVLKPNNTPVYRASDLWISIQPYSVPLERRILALTK